MPKLKKKRYSHHTKGSILILALWSLSLLAIFTVSISYTARQNATLSNRLATQQALYSIAFSGVEKAKGILRKEDWTQGVDTLVEDWSNNPSQFKSFSSGNGAFTVSHSIVDAVTKHEIILYGMIDEDSKININTADTATLKRLIELTTGVDTEIAEDTAFCIIDWRDTDGMFGHPNYGAEDSYYGDLALPYQAKDSKFEVIEELLLVKGITPEIFGKIKRYVTCFGPGAVNINTAPEAVLLALGIDERLLAKIIGYRRSDDGQEGTGDDKYFTQPGSIVAELSGQVPPPDQTERTLLENMVSMNQLGTSSNYFYVNSQAVVNANQAKVDVEAVLDRNGKVFYSKVSQIQWPSKI